MSRLACWASAQRRSLGAIITRKIPAHRCFAVSTEQIWAEARRSPQGILSYLQGRERSNSPYLPVQTGSSSYPPRPGSTLNILAQSHAAPRRRRRVWSARGLAWLALGCFCRGEAAAKTDHILFAAVAANSSETCSVNRAFLKIIVALSEKYDIILSAYISAAGNTEDSSCGCRMIIGRKERHLCFQL